MNDIVTSGKIMLNSNEEYGKIVVSGKLKCEGNAKIASLNANGKVKVYGHLEASDDVIISGKTKIKSINCKNFNCKGKIDIESIKAKDVGIIISANSKIGVIIAEQNVQVQKKEIALGEKEIANLILGMVKADYDYKEMVSEARLDIQELRGKNIKVEDLNAKKIVGDIVIIGKNCVVGEVEYSTSLEMDKASIVKNSKRI